MLMSGLPSCFNPSVGILGGQTYWKPATLYARSGFQSLSRDSWWSNGIANRRKKKKARFQSLSRDSWWSNEINWTLRMWCGFVSIPQSGFLVVKRRWRRPKQGVPMVSIPQSGFLVVKRSGTCLRPWRAACFNPSVGILGGQTRPGVAELIGAEVVSIPQSGFLVVKRHRPRRGEALCRVSIPQSGFLVVKPRAPIIPAWPAPRFNPSVGILGGQTRTRCAFLCGEAAVSIPQSGFLVVKHGHIARSELQLGVSIPQSGFLVVKPHRAIWKRASATMFQSLSRDSWWSNPCSGCCRPWQLFVSIPQSGFLVVKHGSQQSLEALLMCFNPSVGILGGQTHAPSGTEKPRNCFNPSVGILGGQTPRRAPLQFSGEAFQSLSRDSWWSNPAQKAAQPASSGVSIPQSGFLVVKPEEGPLLPVTLQSFNPSVGILGGQTR